MKGVFLTRNNLANKCNWQGSTDCGFCHKDETIKDEGPEIATEGGENGSLKFLLKLLAVVPKSPSNTRNKHCDVYDPNEWMDVP
jgi:hypothetical protein